MHPLAPHIQQALTIGDGLLQTLFGVTQPVDARLACRVHILRLHRLRGTPKGQISAFHHQGFRQGKDCTLAALVLRLTVGFFNQGRYRLG